MEVRYIKQSKGYPRSDEFRKEFLEERCRCCGSPEHSLLKIKSLPRTRSGTPVYEYQCPLVSHCPLYEISKRYPNDEINIRFHLDVEKYAKSIDYSEEKLIVNFEELYHSSLAKRCRAKWEERSIMDSVWTWILETLWYRVEEGQEASSC